MIKIVFITSYDGGSTGMFKFELTNGETDVVNEEVVLLGVRRRVKGSK